MLRVVSNKQLYKIAVSAIAMFTVTTERPGGAIVVRAFNGSGAA